MKTKTGMMTMVLLLAVTTAAAWAAPEDERFRGGSYDGWARDVMAENASLTPITRGTIIRICKIQDWQGALGSALVNQYCRSSEMCRSLGLRFIERGFCLLQPSPKTSIAGQLLRQGFELIAITVKTRGKWPEGRRYFT